METSHLSLGKVKLGLRPEHLYVTDIPSVFNVTIDLIEALGADLLCYCTLVNEKNPQPLVVRVEGHSQVQVGQILHIGIDNINLHLFDPDTEKRLPLHASLEKQVKYA